MLWIATRFIVGKEFASDKKIMLLLAAVIIVVVVPLITAGIMAVLGLLADALIALRDLIDGGGRDYVSNMAPIIAFLLFYLVIKFLDVIFTYPKFALR